jgi:hypothetical protein
MGTNGHKQLSERATSVTHGNKKPRFRGLLRADEGTRTLDLLHGKCARCSYPFAPVGSNFSFAASSSERANTTEPERTPNLALLATPRPRARSALARSIGGGFGPALLTSHRRCTGSPSAAISSTTPQSLIRQNSLLFADS